MSGMQGSPAQAQTPQPQATQTPQAGVDEEKLLQMLQQQMGKMQQSSQMPAMQPVQTHSGNWQPQSLQQAWTGMNNPQQFAQQQAMRQQALRQMQAQIMPRQPTLPATTQPSTNGPTINRPGFGDPRLMPGYQG